MSKASLFRAKCKMLGQDNAPFKNGYVISPQQSSCRYTRRPRHSTARWYSHALCSIFAKSSFGLIIVVREPDIQCRDTLWRGLIGLPCTAGNKVLVVSENGQVITSEWCGALDLCKLRYGLRGSTHSCAPFHKRRSREYHKSACV